MSTLANSSAVHSRCARLAVEAIEPELGLEIGRAKTLCGAFVVEGALALATTEVGDGGDTPTSTGVLD